MTQGPGGSIGFLRGLGAAAACVRCAFIRVVCLLAGARGGGSTHSDVGSGGGVGILGGSSAKRWLNAHLIAGLCSGAAATLLLHPLDLVKVRFQVCGRRVACAGARRGAAAAARVGATAVPLATARHRAWGDVRLSCVGHCLMIDDAV